VLGGVFFVLGVAAPDVLGRDKNSTYPFTLKQMGPYEVPAGAEQQQPA
jgi:hypothetical protein